MLKHSTKVFTILREQKFFCKLQKYQFNLIEVKYLGHIVSQEGVQPKLEKTQKVSEWSVPTNVHALH